MFSVYIYIYIYISKRLTFQKYIYIFCFFGRKKRTIKRYIQLSLILIVYSRTKYKIFNAKETVKTTRSLKKNNNNKNGVISKKKLCFCSTLFFALLRRDTSPLHGLWRKCCVCSCSLVLHSRPLSPWWPLSFLIFSPPL